MIHYLTACIFICSTAFVLFSPISASSVPPFNPEISKSNSMYTYYFSSYDNKLGWNEARDTCVNIGGDLSSVKDIDENWFLISKMRPKDSFWVGLVYNSQLGRQVWTDDTLYGFGNIPNTYPWEPSDNRSFLDKAIFDPQAATPMLSECTCIFMHKWSKKQPCNRPNRYVCKVAGRHFKSPAMPTKIAPQGNVAISDDKKKESQPHSSLTIVMAVLVVIILVGVCVVGFFSFWIRYRNRTNRRSWSGSATATNPAIYNSDLPAAPDNSSGRTQRPTLRLSDSV